MREYPRPPVPMVGYVSGSSSATGSAALWRLKWPACVIACAKERAQQESLWDGAFGSGMLLSVSLQFLSVHSRTVPSSSA